MDPLYAIRKIFENETIIDFSNLILKIKSFDCLTISAIFGLKGLNDYEDIFIFHKSEVITNSESD